MFPDIPRFSKVCFATQRELLVGEIYYSVLVEENETAGNGMFVRHDYSANNWQGPPAEFIGWWRGKVTKENAKSAKLAPNEVLLAVFDRLESERNNFELLYLLTLLLVRRRIFRYERDSLVVVFCPKREMTYEIPLAPAMPDRANELQEQLAQLLYA